MIIIRVVHEHPGIADSIHGPGWGNIEEAERALQEAGWEKDWGLYKKTHSKQGWPMLASAEKLRDITDL